jgi:cytochrome oxidase assembly protein ShyY1
MIQSSLLTHCLLNPNRLAPALLCHLVDMPWKKNMFTPDNKPEEGKFYFPDINQMAEKSGSHPWPRDHKIRGNQALETQIIVSHALPR